MKKASAIILLQFFLISNSGMAVNVHFCGGKLASVNFFSDGGKKCKCGKRSMKPNCCRDNQLQLKANDELSRTDNFTFKIVAPKILFNLPIVHSNLALLRNQIPVADFYHRPPFKLKTPIYLLDRTFLI